MILPYTTFAKNSLHILEEDYVKCFVATSLNYIGDRWQGIAVITDSFNYV